MSPLGSPAEKKIRLVGELVDDTLNDQESKRDAFGNFGGPGRTNRGMGIYRTRYGEDLPTKRESLRLK